MSRENENETWSGVPLTSLPKTGPGSSLFLQYPLDNLPNDEHSGCVCLTPQSLSHPASKLQDSWDAYHVRMPWSKMNLYREVKDGETLMKSKWETIKNTLRTKSIQSSYDLQESILSYSPKYRGHEDWSFSTLHKLMSEVLTKEETEKFFKDTLPKMINILLSSDSIITSPVPLLVSGKSQSIALTQEQASVLLVNAFFCTYPLRNANGSHFRNYPHINFNTLFGRGTRTPETKIQELKCLINYFTRITESTPSGILTFSRVVLPSKSVPNWEQSKNRMSKLHITSEGSIETEGQGMLQVDFANKFVGGGVLTRGMVQEEIRFSVCPELLASLLFTEALDDNEVLLMLGAEQFSQYQGYSRTFTYDGPLKDMTDLDEQGIRKTAIVAMDALKFTNVGDDGQLQFDKVKINRELNKAFIGFSNHGAISSELQAVATGNWGCGAFGGDVRLKFLIQLMAASENMRDMAYFTFGDKTLVNEAGKIHRLLVKKGVTVGQLYKMILNYCQKSGTKSGEELYMDILRKLEKKKKDGKCSLF